MSRMPRLYNIWACMRTRCLNEKASTYQGYGSRGITVCDEWAESYQAFEAWALSHGYRDDLTLDRRDNDGPYSPENCRWATRKEQGNNKRSNRRVSYNGETKTATQYAEELGIPRQTLYRRLQRGWGVSRALTTPVREYIPRGQKIV